MRVLRLPCKGSWLGAAETEGFRLFLEKPPLEAEKRPGYAENPVILLWRGLAAEPLRPCGPPPLSGEASSFPTVPAQNAPPQSGLTPCQLPRRGSFFPNLPSRGRGTAAAAVRRAANPISYSCQWQLYHNLWMRGVAGVSCRKYARSKAPLSGAL